MLGSVQRLSEVPCSYAAKVDAMASYLVRLKMHGVKKNREMKSAVLVSSKIHPQGLMLALKTLVVSIVRLSAPIAQNL